MFLLLNINAILKNVENQTVAGPHRLSCDFFPYTIKFSVDQQLFGYAHILQNIFCVQHKKEMNTGLGQHVSE